MGSRTELYQITRELRRYLEWQLQDGVPGVLPVPSAERDAWQEQEKAREVARAQAMREALFGDSEPKKSSQRVSVPGSVTEPTTLSDVMQPIAEPKKPVVNTAGGGLWNELGSRPRLTFHGGEESEPVPVRSEPVRSEPVRSGAQQSNSTPSQQSEKKTPSEPQKSPPVASSMDESDGYNEGYDESYIDYSENYSEFEMSASPVEVEKPVRRVEMSNAEKLDFLKNYLGDCRRCALHQGRTQVVFGDGNPTARLMFIGESPGKEEDRQGVPFVGVAGDLLNRMIEAMGFQREDVYVASVVKCRSAENRNPSSSEVQECSPFLLKQIEAVQPEVIVALGGLATQTLLGNSSNFTQLRGRWHVWKDIPVMATYNPNSLLRNERLKRDAWNDLQLVIARLAENK